MNTPPINLEKSNPEIHVQQQTSYEAATERREQAEAALSISVAGMFETHAQHVVEEPAGKDKLEKLRLCAKLPWDGENPNSGEGTYKGVIELMRFTDKTSRLNYQTIGLALSQTSGAQLMFDTLPNTPTERTLNTPADEHEAAALWLRQTKRAVRMERWAKNLAVASPEKPTLLSKIAKRFAGKKAVQNTTEIQ